MSSDPNRGAEGGRLGARAKIAGALVLIVGLVGAIAGYAVSRHRRPPTLTIELAQSVSPETSARLETLLVPFSEAHPDVRVRVRYEPYPAAGPATARNGHVEIRSMATGGPKAAPLFASDYMVLAYNRELVDAPPKTWAEIIARGAALKDAGKARFGVAVPDEAYSLVPFFGEVLFDGEGQAREEKARDAFSLLFNLRFARGLMPPSCPSECVSRVFEEAQAPFAVIGEWRLPRLREALGAKMGLSPLPPLPSTDAKLRSLRRDFGVEHADDAPPAEKKVAEELARYLKNDCRGRLLPVLGKVPLPLQTPAKHETQDETDEAALVSVLGGDAALPSESAVQAAVAKLSPIWIQFAEGNLGPNEASQRLVEARSAL